MCFALQPRALFEPLNFQKCSRAEALFSVLHATAACAFWTLHLPSAPTLPCFLILTWKWASRRIGVHLPHLNFQKWSEPEVLCTFWLLNVLRVTTGWLPTRRFSEHTFPPSAARKHWNWKNTMLRDFSTFSRALISFLRIPLLSDLLSLLWLFSQLLRRLSISRKFDF